MHQLEKLGDKALQARILVAPATLALRANGVAATCRALTDLMAKMERR